LALTVELIYWGSPENIAKGSLKARIFALIFPKKLAKKYNFLKFKWKKWSIYGLFHKRTGFFLFFFGAQNRKPATTK
jgi:hypothetical protein